MRPDFDALPYITAELPGTGNRIRSELEHFQVEEVPAYAPSGEGEHLFLLVEKRGLTTRDLVERLKALGIPEVGIGVAGLKDKYAVTRQWISIPVRYQPLLTQFEEAGRIRILESARHRHKLRTGHLRGNRFRVFVEGGEAGLARRVLQALSERGVPNYYGPQRFGLGGRNPEKGLELIRRGKGRGRPWLKRFLIGSVQSLLFNEYLAERIRRGLYDHFLKGDVAKKHDSGGEFIVEDPERENPRAARLEISPTGPLFGRRYFEAQGEGRELEDEILARFDLRREDFRARRGARRPVRVPLEAWKVEPDEGGVWLAFFLPRGSYATSLLREVMKKTPEAREPEEAFEQPL